jgi:hypothetical protein
LAWARHASLNVHPSAPDGIVFDSAAKVAGNGRAPEILDQNAHNLPGVLAE